MKEEFNYLDSIKLSYTVGIVKSREGYIHDAIASISNQDYEGDIDIIVFDNMDKAHTIGYAYNRIAQESKSDVIFYLGDDDFIGRDYIRALNRAFAMFQVKNTPIRVATTFCRLFNDKSDECQRARSAVTGAFAKDFLMDNPFDESLEKFIDMDMYSRIANTWGFNSMIISEIYFGYYYRQHDDNISGARSGVSKWESNKGTFVGGMEKIDYSIIEPNPDRDINITTISS